MADAEDKWLRCPVCGYKEPVKYNEKTNCSDIFIKCKARNCGKTLEVMIINGVDKTKIRDSEK